MYRWDGICMIRAAVGGTGEVTPPPVGGGRASWRAWIERAWTCEPTAEAVEHASPSLAHRIAETLQQDSMSDEQLRRRGLALYRYLLRRRYRPTPFGLFAGVAPAVIDTSARVRWGDEHHVRAYPDAVWLTERIEELERCPAVCDRLTVVLDSTCHVRGDRLILPLRRPRSGERCAPGEVTVRCTPMVCAAITAAACPVGVAELAATLTERVASASRTTVRALLTTLLTEGFLISSLRAPMSVTDPLAYLLEQLDRIGVRPPPDPAHPDPGRLGASVAVPDAEGTVRALYAVDAALRDYSRAGAGRRRSALAAVASAAGVAPDDPARPVFGVDLRLDADIALPRAVADAAARAVSTLARLAPYPAGIPAWQSFHARFLDRYGPGVAVGLREVVDPVTGLGLPAGYRGSAQPRPERPVTGRDHHLLALAQRAAIDRQREVVLGDDDLAALEAATTTAALPHLDVRFRVDAPSRADLERGRFTVVATGLSPTAGSTVGRFLALLSEQDRRRFTARYAALAGIDPTAERLQLSCPPLHIGTDPVARCPPLLPTISVGEHDHAGLRLGDLAVTADRDRLRLVRRTTGSTVEPSLFTAVDLAGFTHPLARLLCELPRAHTAAFGLFPWGHAERLPYLPRIRHGRTVLSPASWRLTRSDLPRLPQSAGPDSDPGSDLDGDRNGDLDTWRAGLAAWAERWMLPELVYLGDTDQQLRLDLNQAADTALLRTRLNAAGSVTLHEAPAADAAGWLDGRAHEITLTCVHTTSTPATMTAAATTAAATTAAATTAAATAATGVPPAPPVVLSGNTRGYPPGDGRWAALTVCTPQRHVPELLIAHLPRLWQGLDPAPPWWFLRRPDGLSLRIRLADELPSFDELAGHVARWASGSRHAGILADLRWETYRPPWGQLGTGTTPAAAEAVFVADSAAALAQIHLHHRAPRTGRARLHPQAVTAASLVELTSAFLGDTAATTRWLCTHLPRTGPAVARSLRHQVLQLIHPHTGPDLLTDTADGVLTAWATRRSALNAYRACLPTAPGVDDVLSELLVGHLNRAVGPDPDAASVCSRLARTAALSRAARHDNAPPRREGTPPR